MKIKWKIFLSTAAILLTMLVSVIVIVYINVEELVTEKYLAELDYDTVKALLVLDEKYDGSWSMDSGNLYKGEVLINNNSSLIYEITEGKSIIATFTAGDMRVATNLVDAAGNEQVGTSISSDVAQTVIQGGQSYRGDAEVLGETAVMEYSPLLDANGNVVGSWVVGIYRSEIMSGVTSVTAVLFEAMLVVLVLGLAVAYVIGAVLSKGVQIIEEKMDVMQQGDFQFEFEDKMLGKKDEIGSMARASSHMKSNIGSVIDNLQVGTSALQESSKQTLDNVESINGEIDEISSVTEQLSSVMEETTAAAQEMNAATAEVEDEIKAMKELTDYVNTLSVEIKGRAENLREKSNNSYNTADAIYNETNVKLRESIERAKTIDEIKELTETILKITAKTNLLAINASIEATRAGEAGKGFAVVAEQIRVLAENSKNAVSSISQITENVSNAVLNVVEDSQSLLEFVDNQVIPDYEMLVETAEQYNNDSDAVKGAIVDISTSSSKLYDSIQNIATGINEVSQASMQGAEQSVEIADKSASIYKKSESVLEQNKTNQESIDELNESIKFFKI